MTALAKERRVQRSADPSEALSCWLEATRRRRNLKSVVLADFRGLLVAGAGPARECDELAAWAPVAAGDTFPEAPPFPVSLAKVPGYDAYVCLPGADEGLTAEDAAAGCSRILSAVA